MSQNEVSVWGSYGSLNDKMFLISAFSFFKVIRKSGRVVKIFKLLGCYYMVKDFIDFNVCFFSSFTFCCRGSRSFQDDLSVIYHTIIFQLTIYNNKED